MIGFQIRSIRSLAAHRLQSGLQRRSDDSPRYGYRLLGAVMTCLLALQIVSVTPVRAAKCSNGGVSNDPCRADSDCCAGLICNKKSRCQVGCKIGGVFYGNGDTNPANPCQSCQSTLNRSGWTNLANGTSCDDHNACTTSDTCQNGTCTGSAPVICPVNINPCQQQGTCNTSTGQCVYPSLPDGTTCNDHNACTTSDTCQSGACTGAAPVICPVNINPCQQQGTCNTSTGQCVYPSLPDGTSCNDHNACTTSDTCQSGTCTGSAPVICPPNINPCQQQGTCDTSTGQCAYPSLPDGTSCNDHNACTTSDTCQSGTCTGSAPVICPPNINPCQQQGTCSGSSGQCVYPALPDGTACNDHNACTAVDTCQSGACTGSAPVPCPAGDQCHDAACDAATGACSNPAKPDGTACDDGDACTLDDACAAGSCTSSSPPCTPTDVPIATPTETAIPTPTDVPDCRGEGQSCGGSIPCCEGECVLRSIGIATFFVCSPCGDAAEPCCAGDTCTNGMICSQGQCGVCGNVSQTCCGGTTCMAGLECNNGFCGSPCGSSGQACCSFNVCDSGLTCNANGLCTAPPPCGSRGQACCTGFIACFDGSTCSGGVCQ